MQALAWSFDLQEFRLRRVHCAFPLAKTLQTEAPGSSFHLPRSPAVASHWRQDPNQNVNLKRPENCQKTCFGQIQVPVAFPEPRLWQIEGPGSSFHLPKSPAVGSHWRRNPSQNVNLKRSENSQKTCFGQIQVPVAFPEPRLRQIEAPGSSFYLPKSPAVASHWRRDPS